MAFCRSILVSLLGSAIVVCTLSVGVAHATHFRFGHLNWQPRTDIAPNAVEFTFVVSARRSAFQCTAHPGQCSEGSTGTYPESERPQIGDTIVEDLGQTTMCFGDGNCTPVLEFDVTAIDVASDWFVGQVEVIHTYSGAGNYDAFSDDCCRLDWCSGINAHINNPNDEYRLETTVDVGSGNSSPVTSLPPIVTCPQNGICSFTIPGVDDGGAVNYRFSTVAEAGFTRQPGPPDCPNAPILNPSTGLFTWDTSGCTLGTTSCGAGFTTLYSAQVTLEDGTSKSAVDFLIQLGPTTGCGANNTPVFDGPTPPCGSTITASVGQTVGFTVQTTDANPGDVVELNCVGAPPGSSFSPTLPTSGSSLVSSAFSWTPGASDIGFHALTCTAGDACTQSLCSLSVAVNDCGNGAVENGEQCDDGNTLDGDCCSSGCQFESAGTSCTDDGNICSDDFCDGLGTCLHPNNSVACDDGEFCTEGDFCSAGSCGPGGPRDCSGANEQCGAGQCNETTDSCDVVPANEGGSCNDGNVCTLGDICTAGTCAGASESCGNGTLEPICGEQCEPPGEGFCGLDCTEEPVCRGAVPPVGVDCEAPNASAEQCDPCQFLCFPGRDPANARRAKSVVFASSYDYKGTNADGNFEIYTFQRKIFDRALRKGATELDALAQAIFQVTDSPLPVTNEAPSVNAAGRFTAFISDGDLAPNVSTGIDNGDGNREIFLYELRSDEIRSQRQITDSLGIDNLNPNLRAFRGNLLVFDSPGDLAAERCAGGENDLELCTEADCSVGGGSCGNPELNREIFEWVRSAAKLADKGLPNAIPLRQLTTSTSGSSSVGQSVNHNTKATAFTSDADLVGENPNGLRQVYRIIKKAENLKQISQVTTAINGVMGADDPSQAKQRVAAFVSDADLTGDNPANLEQIFLWRESQTPAFTQITDTPAGGCSYGKPSIDGAGRFMAIATSCQLLTAPNPGQSVFFYDIKNEAFLVPAMRGPRSEDAGNPVITKKVRVASFELLDGAGEAQSICVFNVRKDQFEGTTMP